MTIVYLPHKCQRISLALDSISIQVETNSSGDRGWHSEHATTGHLFGPGGNFCDYLAFFGLRADPRGEAKTLMADIRDALPLLGPDVIDAACVTHPEPINRDDRTDRSRSSRVGRATSIP